ncbi:hypothetical protein [Methylobacterium sp. JK268]
MSATLPIACEWDGESMVPLARFRQLCDRQFTIGEHYVLAEHEPRSSAAHGHYFACLRDAWESLPEAEAARFPTPEHLRKYALIKAGFRDEQTFVASSKAEARRLAAFLQPVDEFAVISVREAVVIRWTAQSQSMRAMGSAEFQRSKDAVLAVVADMIGVTSPQLLRQGGRAA